MSYFNAPFGISNPDTSPPLGASTSVEDDSVRYDIDPTFDLSFDDGGTPPYNTTGFESGGSSATVATDMPANITFGDLATIDTTTSAPTPAPPPLADYGANPYDFDPLSDIFNWVFSDWPMSSLSNASSNPPPPKDGIGDQINPPHACHALASNFVSTGSTNAGDIAGRVFLQDSLPDLPSEPGISGNFQEERPALAPSHRGGVGSTPRTQRGPAFAPVSENMLCVHFTILVLLTREILPS
ncbi:hypothetical protein EDB84DRAFT_662614 [Lactarius hengduanensis]|nr:hypothetical protein EDB84DRAFT_662614 [Lactarius hengduanensis]